MSGSPVMVNAVVSCRECVFHVKVTDVALNDAGLDRLKKARQDVLGHILIAHNDEKERSIHARS
jgi:hypothetical protein